MDDGTIFYTTWWEGKVYKMIRNGAIPNIDENAEVAFSLSQISAVGGSHTILFRHPSNKFMYLSLIHILPPWDASIWASTSIFTEEEWT